MTVFESSMILFQWFGEKDYFSAEKDFKTIIPISDDERADKDSVKLALKELEEAGLISKSEDSGIWVLKRKLGQVDQEVGITYSTAMELAMVINTFVDIVGSENYLENYQCDPSALKEQDIKSLIFISQMLSSNQKDSVDTPTIS